MDDTRTSLLRNPLAYLAAGVVIGLILGLTYAWLLAPVEVTNVHPYQLDDESQSFYLVSVAKEWAATGNTTRAGSLLRSHPAELRQFLTDRGEAFGTAEERQLVTSMLNAVDEQGTLPGGPTTGGATGLSPAVIIGLCLAGALLIGLVGVVGWYTATRRGALPAVPPEPPVLEMPEGAPAGWMEGAQPVAQFTSKYRPGDVGYDDSFSIDTPAGDFLGECGVGMSETIGVGDPKKITALEVWLFDKNDIRTVTKVLMSEHAFYDDALRAKLAPKGEAILARIGETVLLETQSLQVSARVIELEYGPDGALPPNSYFGKITIELSAWSKETAPASETGVTGM